MMYGKDHTHVHENKINGFSFHGDISSLVVIIMLIEIDS